MRTLWMFHRRLILAVAVAVALATSAGVVLVGSRHDTAAVSHPARQSIGHGARREPSAGDDDSPPTSTEDECRPACDGHRTTGRRRAGPGGDPGLRWPRPRRQRPRPGDLCRLPIDPSADRSDPTAYAIAFATELLDTNYAAQSRADLLAWAEHEEAPNTLPGVPASVAGKALVLSLADPGLPGGTPSPTPSASQWATNAEEGVTQSVDNVEAEVDPDWAQIIAEGWQPRDPRMTIETVTGTMTVTTNGQAVTPESFSLTLTLGTAAHVHAGYGAVAAADWTVG